MSYDFVPHFAHLRAKSTALPFSVGGVVQPGSYPQAANNQDAVGIDVDDNAIIAFVSDGCASNSPYSRNYKSINEVGANIGVVVAIGTARRLLAEPAILDAPEAFVTLFCERYVKSLWHLTCHLAQSRVFGRKMREHIVLEFFMSTLLGAIVTKTRFLVFGKGDGIVVVDGEPKDLAGETGSYPLNDVVLQIRQGMAPRFDRGVACIQGGRSDAVDHVMLASDGFVDFPGAAGLQTMLWRSPRDDRQGYDGRFFREFRSDVGLTIDKEVFHDDRSLVVIRRILGRSEEHKDNHHA